ncbi:hypothetical protein CapIbe_009598 [Capra ibex]
MTPALVCLPGSGSPLQSQEPHISSLSLLYPGGNDQEQDPPPRNNCSLKPYVLTRHPFAADLITQPAGALAPSLFLFPGCGAETRQEQMHRWGTGGKDGFISAPGRWDPECDTEMEEPTPSLKAGTEKGLRWSLAYPHPLIASRRNRSPEQD